MVKEWFILIDSIQEGPFSITDLKKDPRINPDTLVWRAGFPKWVPMRQVPELKSVFEDDHPPKKDEEEEPEEKESKSKKEAIIKRDVIALAYDPLPNWIWIIIIFLILIYCFYKFHAF